MTPERKIRLENLSQRDKEDLVRLTRAEKTFKKFFDNEPQHISGFWFRIAYPNPEGPIFVEIEYNPEKGGFVTDKGPTDVFDVWNKIISSRNTVSDFLKSTATKHKYPNIPDTEIDQNIIEAIGKITDLEVTQQDIDKLT